MEAAPYKSTFFVGSGFHPRPDICATKGGAAWKPRPTNQRFS